MNIASISTTYPRRVIATRRDRYSERGKVELTENTELKLKIEVYFWFRLSRHVIASRIYKTISIRCRPINMTVKIPTPYCSGRC